MAQHETSKTILAPKINPFSGKEFFRQIFGSHYRAYRAKERKRQKEIDEKRERIEHECVERIRETAEGRKYFGQIVQKKGFFSCFGFLSFYSIFYRSHIHQRFDIVYN